MCHFIIFRDFPPFFYYHKEFIVDLHKTDNIESLPNFVTNFPF